MADTVEENAAKPSAPQTRRGANTRARLVSAAKEIFERDGFLDARITDISKRAGLSHGAFYHYFTSKEQLFREVAEIQEERLTAPHEDPALDQFPRRLADGAHPQGEPALPPALPGGSADHGRDRAGLALRRAT